MNSYKGLNNKILMSVDSEIRSIPISYARLTARMLNLSVRRLGRLLSGTGLTEAEFLDDATMLSVSQQIQMTRNAYALSGDPEYGLLLGQWLTPSTHGYLGFLAHSSPNLKTAVEVFAEYQLSRSPFNEITTELNNGWFDCILTKNLCSDDMPVQWPIEPTFMAIQSLIEFILGRRLDEGRLRFAYPAPDYANRYSHYFAGHIEFNTSRNVYSIPESVCYTENASADHEIYKLALEQCRLMLAEIERQTHSTARSVEKVLLSNPPGTQNIGDVASALFVSNRTLIRRLEAEGATFRDLKESQLSALAVKYLVETKLSISSVAALLNYHDTANFRRAFKRWFNQTPSEYRSAKGKSSSI